MDGAVVAEGPGLYERVLERPARAERPAVPDAAVARGRVRRRSVVGPRNAGASLHAMVDGENTKSRIDTVVPLPMPPPVMVPPGLVGLLLQADRAATASKLPMNALRDA